MNTDMLFIALDDPLDINITSFLVEELGRPINTSLDIKHRKKNPRNVNYCEVTVPKYNDDLFKEHFRMSRATFEDLVNVVGHALQNNDKILSVELQKKVLFTVWTLAKPESFLAVGDRFGLAKSSGHAIFKQIVTILSNLMPQYITWPTVNNYGAEANTFQMRSGGFPGIIGAIDGCHIPCRQPIGNANDYYNRKGFHSIILQGVCDHRGRFIDVFIGMPGRIHDARVFRNSPLFGLLNSMVDPLVPPNYHLIGDSAYPLLKNLMTPFRDNGHLQNYQTIYNIKLSSVRSIIERVFGILKGKFRRLKFLDMSDLVLANKVIGAACMLHNFIIDHGEVNEEQSGHFEDDNNDEHHFVQEEQLINNDAVMKRNSIADLFN